MLLKKKFLKTVLLFCFIFCFSLFFLNKSYCASENIVYSTELSKWNDWTVNITLPKYEVSGERINYTVREESVPNGYTQSVDGLTLTNNLDEAKVITKYIDKMTSREIMTSKTEEGYVGLEYSTTPEEITGYKLVGSSGVTSGTMTKSDIVVEYYYVRLGSLTINKVDKDNKTITNGVAKFEIYDENNNKLHFIKNEKDYTVSENKADLDYIETTKGQALVKNIVVGNYKIKEIKAPDGYFLSSTKKDIKLTSDNFDVKIDIVNKKAFSLPLTGGKSMLFVAITSVFLISLGACLILKKLKERKN